MPKQPKNHCQCRSDVCLMCDAKAKSMVDISPAMADKVRVHFFPDFDLNNQKLSKALCSRDRNLLNKVASGKVPKEKLPVFVDHSAEFADLPEDLNDLTDCQCHLCCKAKWNAGTPGKRPPSFPMGRPPSPSSSPSPAKEESLCFFCHAVIAPGKPHSCNKTGFRKNLEELLDDDPDFQEQIAAKVIRRKVAEASSSASSSSASSSIELKTGGGKTMKVPIPKASTSKARFPDETPIPAEEFQKLLTAAGASNNQGKVIAEALRNWKGRKFFTPEMAKQISQLDKTLEDFYKVKDVLVDSSRKDEDLDENGKVLRPLFYCDDVPGLIQYVMQKRGYPADTQYFVKIGMDKGGCFLKFCLNIEKKWDAFSSPRHKRRRANYKDGLFAKKFKSSGVKKLLPLAFIQDTTESFDNLELIVKLLDLNSLEYCPAMDLKLGLTFLGLGTAASSFPCPYCNLHKKDFSDPLHVCSGGVLRDFGSIERNAHGYQEAAAAHKGAQKLSSKEFESAEHSSIFDPEDVSSDSLVVHHVPPFPLHLWLGLGNLLAKKVMDKISTSSRDAWLKPLGLVMSAMHGGQFNGNMLTGVLGSTDRLRTLLSPKEFDSCCNLLEAMDQLESVRAACFSATFLDVDFKDKIKELATLWLKIGLPVTPKAHILFVHVAQFLDFQNENSDGPPRGLGYWSEQASESVHHDFQKLWISGSYKRELGHSEYKEKTLKCIVTYASRHI